MGSMTGGFSPVGTGEYICSICGQRVLHGSYHSCISYDCNPVVTLLKQILEELKKQNERI